MAAAATSLERGGWGREEKALGISGWLAASRRVRKPLFFSGLD